jgi:hypothetical protein
MWPGNSSLIALLRNTQPMEFVLEQLMYLICVGVRYGHNFVLSVHCPGKSCTCAPRPNCEYPTISAVLFRHAFQIFQAIHSWFMQQIAIICSCVLQPIGSLFCRKKSTTPPPPTYNNQRDPILHPHPTPSNNYQLPTNTTIIQVYLMLFLILLGWAVGKATTRELQQAEGLV